MNRFTRSILTLAGAGLMLLLLALAVAAQTPSDPAQDPIKVPDDYPTIQEAIDAAQEGDEIWVAEGTYTENLSISKGVALYGGWNITFTVQTSNLSWINANGMGRAISITCPTSDTQVLVDGFRIINGDATGLGAPSLALPPGPPPLSAGAPGWQPPVLPLGGWERPPSARTTEDLTPSQAAVQLEERLAVLAAAGRYPGGRSAYEAMRSQLARRTAQAEAARASAGARPAAADRLQEDVGVGGGVYSRNASLTLRNCLIQNNVASQQGDGAGGGVYAESAPPGGLVIANNTVLHNVAAADGDGYGGGIYVVNAPGAIIGDNHLEDNTATGYGDGLGGGLVVYKSPGVEVADNEFVENIASKAGSGTEGHGGAILVDASPDAVLHDNSLERNTATAAWDADSSSGGGLAAYASDGLVLRDNLFRGNLAAIRGQGAGGGLHLAGINDALVTGNELRANWGAVFCGGSGATAGGGMVLADVYDSAVSANRLLENATCVYGTMASELDGGGMYAGKLRNDVFSGNVFTGNIACMSSGFGAGGAAYFQKASDVTVAENDISDNAGSLLDAPGAGGGLYLINVKSSQVLRNRITGNRAGATGGLAGGVLWTSWEGESTQATVDGNLILNNQAGGDPTADSDSGCCFFGPVFDGFSFANNVVAGNQAGEVGGLWLILYGPGELVNNTIAGNSDVGVLASARFPTATVALTNNIVVSQTVGITVTEGMTATVSYTLWHGNGTDIAGDGVITHTHPVTGAPAFVDPAANDYRITILSAARDAGDPAGVPPAPDHDAGWLPRPQGAAVDIGAYEWMGYWTRLPLVDKLFTPRAGWAIGTNADGAGAIVHTDDGGLTWQAQGNPALWTGMPGNDISAVDDQTAWAALGSAAGAPGGAILHTTDGGVHWVPQAIPAGLMGGIKGVKGLSRTEAWAASLGGAILHTTDGGATWNVVPHPTTAINDVNRIDALGSSDVWIASPNQEHGGNSNMIHTQDNGLTWRQEPLPNVPDDHGPMSVNAVSPLVAWTALNRSGNVYRTLDGGANWLLVTTIAAGSNDADDLCAAGPEAAWVVLTPGTGDGMLWRVHVAADGSVDAREFQPASKAFTYEGITCLDERAVWAVGGNPLHAAGLPLGVIVITHDGGKTWLQGSAPADIEYWKVSFAGARR